MKKKKTKFNRIIRRWKESIHNKNIKKKKIFQLPSVDTRAIMATMMLATTFRSIFFFLLFCLSLSFCRFLANVARIKWMYMIWLQKSLFYMILVYNDSGDETITKKWRNIDYPMLTIATHQHLLWGWLWLIPLCPFCFGYLFYLFWYESEHIHIHTHTRTVAFSPSSFHLVFVLCSSCCCCCYLGKNM